jgi:hypothetical protein
MTLHKRIEAAGVAMACLGLLVLAIVAGAFTITAAAVAWGRGDWLLAGMVVAIALFLGGGLLVLTSGLLAPDQN